MKALRRPMFLAETLYSHNSTIKLHEQTHSCCVADIARCHPAPSKGWVSHHLAGKPGEICDLALHVHGHVALTAPMPLQNHTLACRGAPAEFLPQKSL